MGRLILLRHGQSEWNKKNIFTGWVDVPLSKEGIVEAQEAGNVLRDMEIDLIFSSTLVRALQTAMIAMANHPSGKVPVLEHDEKDQRKEWGNISNEQTQRDTIPVYQAWQLNERMYGELQGNNKDEMRRKYGEHQVAIWRRSYDVPPPAGESLHMTAERTLPYFNEKILPAVQEGRHVLVSAHGNSLRSIIMKLNGLSKDDIPSLEVPTGKPMIYEIEDGVLCPVST